MFYTLWTARVDRRRRKPVSIRRRRSVANTIKGDLMRILENRGNWYKGNLHMHTTMSDGVLDPVEAINVYREAGYDFIAITDHRKVGHLWQDNSFLILPGVEWDTGDAVNMPVYHILGIGMDRETVDFYHGALMKERRSGIQERACGSEDEQIESAIIPTRRRSSKQSGRREVSRSSHTLRGP